MAPGPVGGKLYMAEVNLPPLPFDVCLILITRSTPSNQSGASWFAELCNALSNSLGDSSRSFRNSSTMTTLKGGSITPGGLSIGTYRTCRWQPTKLPIWEQITDGSGE